jgi:hypothetical protein
MILLAFNPAESAVEGKKKVLANLSYIIKMLGAYKKKF